MGKRGQNIMWYLTKTKMNRNEIPETEMIFQHQDQDEVYQVMRRNAFDDLRSLRSDMLRKIEKIMEQQKFITITTESNEIVHYQIVRYNRCERRHIHVHGYIDLEMDDIQTPSQAIELLKEKFQKNLDTPTILDVNGNKVGEIHVHLHTSSKVPNRRND